MELFEHDGSSAPQSSACFGFQLRIMVSGVHAHLPSVTFPPLPSPRFSSVGPKQSCDLSKQESVLGEP